MSASLEWTEWHLTASGWVRGTMKTDSNISVIARPTGAVATFMYSEEHSGYGRSDGKVTQIEPKGPISKDLQNLLRLHGDCPRQL